jgi:hypothetical protein
MVPSASSIIDKITGFLGNTIIPLARELQDTPPGSVRMHVDLVASADDTLHNMLALVHSECPELLHDKRCFMTRTSHAYDLFIPAGGASDKKIVPHDDHEETPCTELADVEEQRLQGAGEW